METVAVFYLSWVREAAAAHGKISILQDGNRLKYGAEYAFYRFHAPDFTY